MSIRTVIIAGTVDLLNEVNNLSRQQPGKKIPPPHLCHHQLFTTPPKTPNFRKPLWTAPKASLPPEAQGLSSFRHNPARNDNKPGWVPAPGTQVVMLAELMAQEQREEAKVEVEIELDGDGNGRRVSLSTS
jgi:hypothetical protein